MFNTVNLLKIISKYKKFAFAIVTIDHFNGNKNMKKSLNK